MDNKVAKKILLWSLVGPFLLLLALLTYQVHTGPKSFVLAVSAVLAVASAAVWRTRGLLTTLLLMATVLVWCYGGFPAATRIWQIAWTCSIGVSTMITALCMNEVRNLIGGVQRESASRLDQLWQLDEKHKELQERWRLDREDFDVRSKLSDQDLCELRGALENREQTLSLAHDELKRQASAREELLEELLSSQRRVAELEHELGEQREEILGMSSSPELDSELQERVEELSRQIRDVECEREGLHDQIVRLREKLRHEKPQKSDLERELARYQGMHKQLREQFEEKDLVLKNTRTELFEAEGKIHTLKEKLVESQRREASKESADLEAALAEVQNKDEEIQALNALVTNLMEEISSRP